MKTQNTPENRSKFRALYYNQNILTNGYRLANSINPLPVGYGCNAGSSWFLNLKPLSSISDEDAIEVAMILSNYQGVAHHTFRVAQKEEVGELVNHKMVVYSYVDNESFEWISIDEMKVSGRRIRPELISYAVDFLRSKGYLLGWLDLTPEDIIAYGWCRLEEQG